jgi:outer membrane protein TolC
MVLSGLTFQRVVLRTVFTLLSLVGVTCFGAPSDDIAGTMPEDYLPELKQILAHALTRSPESIAREFDRVIQEARLTMAKAARLPNVGGNFDYGLTQTATASNTSSQSSNTGAQYSFNIGQALWHWGAIKNEIEIGRLNVLVAAKDTARLYRDTCLVLRKAYLSLIVQKARLRQARDGFELVKVDLEVAKKKKEDGTISGAELAGTELRVREAELQLGRAVAEFERSRYSFARVAGLPDLPEDAIPAEIPRPAYQEPVVAAVAAKTLRDNARGTIEFEIYDMKLREAQLRQKIVGTRLLPKFGVGAGYSLRNNTYVNGPTVNQEAVTEQRVAVSGSWAMFDGFATSGAKREAAANRRALEYKKSIEIDQLLQTVQQLERTLKLDAEQLELAEIRHGIATSGQEMIAEGVKLGNLPKAEIERGRVSSLLAYANKLEARAVFLGRWAELVSTAGVDPVLNNLPDRNAAKK